MPAAGVRCPKCKKRVAPKVPDALPNATLGNTLSQIVEVFNVHLQLKVTPTKPAGA